MVGQARWNGGGGVGCLGTSSAHPPPLQASSQHRPPPTLEKRSATLVGEGKIKLLLAFDIGVKINRLSLSHH